MDSAPLRPSVYLAIDTDGTVYIIAHRSEMGSGSKTALPRIVADELDADWARVKIVQAPGDEKYGDQDTDGSHSVKSFFDPLARSGRHGATDAGSRGGCAVGQAGLGVPHRIARSGAHAIGQKIGIRRTGGRRRKTRSSEKRRCET